MTGRRKSQTINTIFEGIYITEANASIHLMEGQKLNCTGVKGIRGGWIITWYWEWILQYIEVIYTWDQQRGGHCIHEPIHSATDPRDNTGVVGMDTDYIIYIHFYHFYSLSHSSTMACRHGHYPWLLWAQVNQHWRYLRCLVAPIFLDLSTWPRR